MIRFPFYAWISVLNTIFPDPTEELLARYLSPQDIPYLGLLAFAFPRVTFQESLEKKMVIDDEEAKEAKVISLVISLLHAKAKEIKILLILEDLHWMDDQSWKVLLALLAKLDFLFLLATTRPLDDFSNRESLGELCDKSPDFHYYKLTQLIPSNVIKLICSIYNCDSVDPKVENILAQHCSGVFHSFQNFFLQNFILIFFQFQSKESSLHL